MDYKGEHNSSNKCLNEKEEEMQPRQAQIRSITRQAERPIVSTPGAGKKLGEAKVDSPLCPPGKA